MNKRIFSTITLLSILWLTNGIALAGRVSHSIRISTSTLILTDTVINNLRYVLPQIEGLWNTGEPGNPSLPIMDLVFSVPQNSTNYKIEIAIHKYEHIKLNALPYPQQAPVLTNESPDESNFTHLNIAGFNNIETIPEKQIKIEGDSFLGGFNKIVRINLIPLLYKPLENAFELATDFTVDLFWDEDKIPSSITYPNNALRIEELKKETMDLVINPDDVSTNSIDIDNKLKNQSNKSQKEIYDYLIITSFELSHAFEKLAAIRKSKGYRTRIFLIEDILNDERFEEGDVVSGINDDAGKLRAFLTHAYEEFSTKYVLLGGDYSIIPVRFGYGNNRLISSDLYYCELNQSWGVNKNGNIGYCYDMTDFDCELAVGRLTCNTEDEVFNYIDKLEIYEFNPGNGDMAYLDNAFIAVGAGLLKCYYGNYSYKPINEAYANVFEHITENLQEPCTEPSGREVVDHLNEGQFGYVDFLAHGSPEAVATTEDHDKKCTTEIQNRGINALDRENLYLVSENGNGLDCIKNKYYPNWSFSMSCSIMPLQYSERQLDCDTTLSYNFGESYILGKNYGGIALWGHTEDGWMSEGNRAHIEFFKLLHNTISENQFTEIGPLGCKIKSLISRDHLNKLQHNLMGDPLINIWCKKPTLALDIHSDSVTSMFLGQINLFKPSIIQRESILSTSFEKSDNVIYTVYGPNILPYIYPLTITGINFNYNSSFYVNQLTLGTNEAYTPDNPDVSFLENSKITIYSLGKIDFKGTVILEKGSVLTIDSNKPVTIKNTSIKNGAELIIKAPSISIDTNFHVESGGKFNFINHIAYD